MAVFVSKTWTDIIADYPSRYKLHHADSTVEQVTMENDFGTISQSGDVFDALTFNDLELRISNGFASCAEALSGTTAPTAADGKDGDTYYQTETVGQVTSVVAVFIKIAGAWLQTSQVLPAAEGGAF